MTILTFQIIHHRLKLRMVDAPIDVVIQSPSLSVQMIQRSCEQRCKLSVWSRAYFNCER